MQKHGIAISFRALWRDEQSIILTDREYQIVEALLRTYPNAIHKERMFRNVWGAYSDVQMKTVDVFICKLRKRLGHVGLAIETVFGMGYRLVVQPINA